jgi:UDP-N-acetylmuramoyl-L-alanyl-D-glutamate--2,6-diaminopimelate ligase
LILDDLFEGVKGIRVQGDKMTEVTSISYDSRRVVPGDLFAAIRGENFDGTHFIGEAAERGAKAFLVPEDADKSIEGTCVYAENVREALAMASRNFFSDPASRMKIAGITGTNGKTTTSYLAHGILESAGFSSGLIGTVQYLVGGQVLSAARTTPESPDLQAMLKAMLDTGCRSCIMEVSSHAITLQRVTGVTMEVGVFMNLTRDHLDFHRDMEDYYSAKASLFEKGQVRNRVINRDDPYGARMLNELGSDVLTFGMDTGDIHIMELVDSGDWGSRFRLRTPWGEVQAATPLPGRFNLYNVMAAAGVCGLLGLQTDAIAEGLSLVKRVPGRFERVDRGQPWTAIVDYAHTPDALENLLENTRDITEGRVILVFGCGGDRDTSKRPLMGAAAERLADRVFISSDNPRGEDPESIIDDIMGGVTGSSEKVVRVTDRREAISMAVREARPGDVVLLAGKGHENYQIIGKRVLPFSDVDELAKAIEETPGVEI